MGKQSNIHLFYQQVYALVRRIPAGYVTSYGRIAQMLWRPHGARAVGYALRALKLRPWTSEYAEIPWHRVLSSEGYLRVATPGEEAPLQVERLREEGVAVELLASGAYRADIRTHLWPGLSPQEIEMILDELGQSSCG